MDAVLGDDEVSVDGDGRDGEGGHEDAQVGQGLHQPEKKGEWRVMIFLHFFHSRMS